MNCEFENFNKSNNVYNVDFHDIWHGRFGHVNYNFIKRVIKLNMIAFYDTSLISHCKICVQSKILVKLFQHVNHGSPLLELIYPDVCEIDNTITSAKSDNL